LTRQRRRQGQRDGDGKRQHGDARMLHDGLLRWRVLFPFRVSRSVAMLAPKNGGAKTRRIYAASTTLSG
jgi:hypothetical protein